MEPRDDSYREKYDALDLKPGEVMKEAWVAARYADEVKSVGGNLVLTNQRLLFEPLKTQLAISALSKFFSRGSAAPVGEEIGELGKWRLLHPWSGSLAEVNEVQPVENDRLRVVFRSGESIVFRIAAGRWTPRWPEGPNKRARDTVIQVLRATTAASPTGAP